MTRYPVVVEQLPGTTIAERRMELVARKGIGRPDTIRDSLVEAPPWHSTGCTSIRSAPWRITTSTTRSSSPASAARRSAHERAAGVAEVYVQLAASRRPRSRRFLRLLGRDVPDQCGKGRNRKRLGQIAGGTRLEGRAARI